MSTPQVLEINFDEIQAKELQLLALQRALLNISILESRTPGHHLLALAATVNEIYDAAIAGYAGRGYQLDGSFDSGALVEGWRMQRINEGRDHLDDFRFVNISAFDQYLEFTASYAAYQVELSRGHFGIYSNRGLLSNFESSNNFNSNQNYIVIAPAVFAAAGEFSSCLVPALVQEYSEQ